MKEIDGSMLMKKMFIILLGAISVFGGCSSDVDDKKIYSNLYLLHKNS